MPACLQMSELTLLVASYINHIIQREGIQTPVAQVNQLIRDVEMR